MTPVTLPEKFTQYAMVDIDLGVRASDVTVEDRARDGGKRCEVGLDPSYQMKSAFRLKLTQRRNHHQAALVAGQGGCFLKGGGIGACHDDAPSAPIVRVGGSCGERGFSAKR